MHLLALLLILGPRFGYILDHFGYARSHRRASARRSEARLYQVFHTSVDSCVATKNDDVQHRQGGVFLI